MSNMVIATNILALNSHRSMKVTGTSQSRASARLSSGYKINSAADDAAGLAISEKMRSQIRGLDMASKNAQDASSLIQTAEGGMQEIDNMVQRIRELVVQASNDTNEHNNVGTGDRQKIQDEINQLVEEIDSMAERVEFNKKKVINGDCGGVTAGGESSRLAAARGNDRVTRKALVDATKVAAEARANAASALSAIANLDTSALTALYNELKGSLDGTAKGVIDTALASFDGIKALTDLVLLEDPYASGMDATIGDVADLFATGGDIFDEVALAITAATATGDADQQAAATKITDAMNALVTAAAGMAADLNTKAQTFDTARTAETTASTARTAAQAELVAARAAYDAAEKVGGLYFQVGANAYQSLEMTIGSVKSDLLGIGDGEGQTNIDILSDSGIDITYILDNLDEALSYVTTERSKLGAAQNRLEYTQRSLDISSENLSASESRIRDADMAKEMMALTQANVLQQAAVSMLAQANQAPQAVLQLLR